MQTLNVTDERRDGERLENVAQLVRCRLKSELLKVKAGGGECRIVDVSSTGFGVETLDKLPVGTDIQMDITFCDEVLHDADAFVAYCHFEEDHYRLGLVFDFRKTAMFTPHAYNFLSRMLDHVAGKRDLPGKKSGYLA